MFNATLIGNLGKDPETRFTPSGLKVTTFSVAVNMKKGKEEITIWVRVTVWGDRLDKILSYLKKGSLVVITGRMNPPSNYVDKEGRTQFSLELTAEMIDFPPSSRSDRNAESANSPTTQERAGGHNEPYKQQNSGSYGSGNNSNYSYAATGGNANNNHSEETVDDDSLPF